MKVVRRAPLFKVSGLISPPGAILVTILATILVSMGGCVTKGSGGGVQADATKLAGVAVEVSGPQARSGKPVAAGPKPVGDTIQHDVVVVGGNLAALTSAIYLTDAGKKVLLLEPGSQLGASVAWSEGRENARALSEANEILKRLGAGGASSPAPDSGVHYLVRGNYVADLWNPKTLAKLPASFQVFAFELARAGRERKIPAIPFEESTKSGGNMELDAVSAEAWIKSLPNSLAVFAESGEGSRAEAKKLGDRFTAEKRRGGLPGVTGMEDVLELADSYCRLNFGAPASEVSAMAFAAFYAGVLEARARGYDRRADVVAKILQKLENRALLFMSKTEAPVTAIGQNAKGVEIFYNQGSESRRVTAKYVVLADLSPLVPETIANLPTLASAQTALLRATRTSNLLEHEFLFDGQPLRTGSELWLRPLESAASEPMALELWRWPAPASVLPAKKNAAGEDPKSDAPKTETIVVREFYGEGAADLSDEDVKRRAAAMIVRLSDGLGDLPKSVLKDPLHVQKIATRRWPSGTHAPKPGFFSDSAPKLRQPFGRVFFASNLLGVPSMEEALFRGHCAASSILSRVNKAYRLESWSRCPVDQTP